MSRSPSSARRWLLAIVVLGLIVRLGVAIRGGLNAPPTPGSDQAEYALIAHNLVHGNGYTGISWGNPQEHPTAYRAPVMPLVWAASFGLFGERYDLLRLFGVLVSTATIPIFFLIGKRLFGVRAGLMTAFGVALYPMAIFLAPELLTETLFVFLQGVAVLLCLRGVERPTAGRFVLAGIACGVATLTRPNLLLTLPLLPVWAAIVYWKRWPLLMRCLLVPVVAVLTLLPWTIRNHQIFHRWVAVVTLSGSNLYMGNNDVVVTDSTLFGREQLEDRIPGFNEAVRGLGEADRDARAGELAKAWLKSHPDKWGFLVWHKFKRFVSPALHQDSRIARLGMLFSWGPTFWLGAAMLLWVLPRWCRTRHPGLLLHAIVGTSLAGMLVLYVIPRFRFPTELIFLLFAAGAIEQGLVWLAARRAVADDELTTVT